MDTTRYPALGALRVKQTELTDKAERITGAISRGESTLTDLHAERERLRRGVLSARTEAAAAQMQEFLSGSCDVGEAAPDERRIVALATTEGKIETVSDGLKELHAMHANTMRELAAVQASREAEADRIAGAALAAEAAELSALIAKVNAKAAIVREWLGNPLHRAAHAAPRGTATILELLERLPRDDFQTAGNILRGGNPVARDRWQELCDELLADDSEAEAKESVAA